MTESPYIIVREVVEHRHYNPNYGDDRICKCGHTYYRHFDTYEKMSPVGCKYCYCGTFEEISPEITFVEYGLEEICEKCEFYHWCVWKVGDAEFHTYEAAKAALVLAGKAP